MDLSGRITRLPHPVDPDAGREAAGNLGALSPLVEGAAGSSPHLAGLVRRQGAWLGEAAGDPEAALATLVADARSGEGKAADRLRISKQRLGLLVALCDLGGVWSLEEVTGALTAFADAAVHASLEEALDAERARGRLEGDPRIFALAMGKMGAGELNYSSDVDLILLFEHGPAARYAERRASVLRAVRNAVRTLSEPTAEGLVFRTDLRLRPDPSTTPVAMPTDAALAYYESLGRGWERAAHVKARPAAGDVAAGAAYLDRLRPFVWRRHLDFPALREAAGMLAAIRAQEGGGAEVVGHNLKKGRGGIREIEFAAQSLQLVHGGRDPSLRARGTLDALAALAAAGRMPARVADEMSQDYRTLREAEHRLQMVRDAQTQRVPEDPAELARVAGLAGYADPADWLDVVAAALERTHRNGATVWPDMDAPAPPKHAALDAWRSAPALRSAGARAGLDRIAAPLLARVEASPRPAETLAALEGFVRNLPSGAQVFALFEANPALMDLVVDVAGTAPGLARHLARQAGVLDAVISGEVFGEWPGVEALAAEFEASVARADDHEGRLVALRRAAAERRFAAGIQLLRGVAAPEEAGRRHAEIAEAVLRAALPVAVAETERRHGTMPGEGAAILGMGSLGGGRLDPGSDLDVIVVYDADPGATSDGPRPLEAARWYAKMTQALITALSAPMAGGVLYEVDTRLRPSGRRGPVATSVAAFERYHEEDAWVWEHLALTRARFVAGEAALGDRLEAFRRDLIARIGREGDPARIARETQEMRDRVFSAHPGGGWALRDGPGGIRDVELTAQAAALVAGSPTRSAPEQIALWGGGALEPAWRLGADLRMALRLVAPDGVPEDGLGPALATVNRIAGLAPGADPLDRLAPLRRAAADEIDARLAAMMEG